MRRCATSLLRFRRDDAQGAFARHLVQPDRCLDQRHCGTLADAERHVVPVDHLGAAGIAEDRLDVARGLAEDERASPAS
jgi:hypothetical protein